ncbi:hypothetical protein S83_050243 [Arachis hypogaea]
MRRLQQEQTEAYLAMKEPGKSIDRNLVRTDLPKRRMTESSTSGGVMMNAAKKPHYHNPSQPLPAAPPSPASQPLPLPVPRTSTSQSRELAPPSPANQRLAATPPSHASQQRLPAAPRSNASQQHQTSLPAALDQPLPAPPNTEHQIWRIQLIQIREIASDWWFTGSVDFSLCINSRPYVFSAPTKRHLTQPVNCDKILI